MIRRKNSPAQAPADDVPAAEGGSTTSPGKKGRPTPKRRQAEALNKRPLVVNDRKEAKRIARQKRQEAYLKQREAMRSGNERYLPLRDKGKPRRWVRDYVDARWSIAEFFMPVALLMIVAMMIVAAFPQIANYMILGTYGVLVLSLADSLFMVWRVKRKLRQRFSEDEIPRWTGLYAFFRSFYLRRMRQPDPQVKRGEFPA
ncbi:DUF3043 domain-containing protein [Bogoriella caseilytica]|uniref:DUF3043 family protein n=1 Tax=Bogoriella caseilytica TaxID=56055 RepID=A0A3N2B9M3_9MICO|nr:DUF3043 domain-containing protein [Bogoriella caseilytica]ROR71794.1 hypothetical protein EDD31_0132 [Bogoriella caseilytica]